MPLFFIACGGDSDTATSPMKNSSADMEVSTYDGLPTCAEKREGKTAYVKDQDQGYVCKAGKWVEDEGAVKIYSSERKLSFCYCYNNSVDSCTKYGRLYTWAAAKDSVGAWCLSQRLAFAVKE